MNLFIELFEVFMKNQIEMLILIFGVVFAWKFFFGNSRMARETRREFNRWITISVPFEIEFFLKHCIRNPFSYSGLNQDRMDDVLYVMRLHQFSTAWSLVNYASAKLRLPSHEISKIIKALENLGKIQYENYQYKIVQHSNNKVINN